MRTPVASLDLETRSACSLKACGASKYAQDPTTEVLCACFRLPWWPEGQTGLWHPAMPTLGLVERRDDLADFFMWVVQGGLVESHNSAFESALWRYVLTPRHGWPVLPTAQRRCSAAKAAAHALPRGLDDAVAALGLSIRKDAAGSKVMKKLTKPRKPRKAEVEAGVTGLLWWESVDLLEQLFAYCRQDVLVEEALSDVLEDLSPAEQALYTLDQCINERGFRLDRVAVGRALLLIESEAVRLNGELAALTGGVVKKATQRAQLKRWLESEGLFLEDTQAGTLDALLSDDCMEPLTTPARQALTLLRALGRSSTAKYEAMQNWICPDDRVHGGLVYHGASTGRWTGAGIQPQNFPRGTLKNPDTPKAAVDMDDLWFCLKGDRNTVESRYGGVLESLSHALRGAIVASPGKLLYVSDFAGIEARVLLWQAGELAALDLFRTGADIYLDMASSIYDKVVTKDDKAERALGKVAILGLGYQMGWTKFQATALLMAGLTIDDELAQRTVAAYREKYAKVQQLWWDQEAAAIAAVQCRGRIIDCGRVSWVMRERFLSCVLPSGRRLSYPDAAVEKRATPWGAVKPALTYMGVNAYTRKWQRQHSYGGLLVENLTQAISRDLMAEAITRIENTGIYHTVLSVHDEIVSEGHPALGDVEAFGALVAETPGWAEGLPVATESWVGPRYRK